MGIERQKKAQISAYKAQFCIYRFADAERFAAVCDARAQRFPRVLAAIAQKCVFHCIVPPIRHKISRSHAHRKVCADPPGRRRDMNFFFLRFQSVPRNAGFFFVCHSCFSANSTDPCFSVMLRRSHRRHTIGGFAEMTDPIWIKFKDTSAKYQAPGNSDP